MRRADVAQDPGRAIAARRVLDQLGRLVDEGRVRLAGGERRVEENVLQKRQVRLHTADAELAQGADHLAAGVVPLEAAGGDLGEQRVVVGRDARPDVARAVVEADAEARRRPVDLDLAGVGEKVVPRILGGDTNLNGDAALDDLRLAADPDLRIGQAIALGDPQLRLHQIAPGDRLGHRVLDLDARVDLDEVVAAVLADQELDRAGVRVVHLARDLERVVRQPRPELLGERPGRRVLDDLLVAPLHRAVALVEVDQVAVVVAEDLHLDVLRPQDQLLQKDRIVAERLPGLRARALEQLGELAGAAHDAHAAPAAAGRSLDHHRIADAVGEGPRRFQRLDRLGRPRHRRHTGGGRDLPRGHLVAQRVDRLGRWPDEDDPRLAALPRERGPLGEQAIARMNRVDLVPLGQLDDLVLGQVGRHRLEALADQIGLVGLVAVQVDAILFREDRHGAEAELGAGAEDADRDLSAVRAEDALERANRAALGTAESVVGRNGFGHGALGNYHLSAGAGKGGLALYAEQQIHRRLIRGGKTVVLEFARRDPAAIGDSHGRRFSCPDDLRLVERQVDRVAVVVVRAPADVGADRHLDADPLAHLAQQRLGVGLAFFDAASGELPQSSQHGRGAALGDEVALVSRDDGRNDPQVGDFRHGDHHIVVTPAPWSNA